MDMQRSRFQEERTATPATLLADHDAAFIDAIDGVFNELHETKASMVRQPSVIGVLSHSLRHTAFAKGLLLAQPDEMIHLQRIDLAQINELLLQRKTQIAGVIDSASASVMMQLTRHHHAIVHWLCLHKVDQQRRLHLIVRSKHTDRNLPAWLKRFSDVSDAHPIDSVDEISVSTKRGRHHQLWAAHLSYQLASACSSHIAAASIDVSDNAKPAMGNLVSFILETP